MEAIMIAANSGDVYAQLACYGIRMLLLHYHVIITFNWLDYS